MVKVENATTSAKTPATRLAPWSASSNDRDFPRRFSDGLESQRWESLHGIGNRDILSQQCLAFICSIQCPGSVVIKTFDAIRQLRDAGVVIAGGFHSPMEKECLEFLLRGTQPIIVAPARGLERYRPPREWRNAMETGKLLVVSPFEPSQGRTTAARAAQRNAFVAEMAAAVLAPHASPGGKTDAIAHDVLGRNQPLFTFPTDDNADLLARGAQAFDLDAVVSAVKSPVSSSAHAQTTDRNRQS